MVSDTSFVPITVGREKRGLFGIAMLAVVVVVVMEEGVDCPI